MREATGVEEPLSAPQHKEGALKKLLNSRFRDRRLFVAIDGSTGRLRLRRTSQELNREDSIFRRAGFEIAVNEHANNMNPSLPPVTGYSTSYPLILVSCLADVENCMFTTDYNQSKISFPLARSQAASAHEISRQIIQMLDRHQVAEGS